MMSRFFLYRENFKQRSSGLSYIETVVGVAIFALVAVSLYTTYERIFVTVRTAQSRVNATALINEQFEIARNLPYAQVGTVGGVPSGVLLPVQTLVRSGMTFVATTTVRNIDQPFDGIVGGSPNDLSPADNKLIEIQITCLSCANFRPMTLTTIVAPKDLEGASTNGSLFIRVMDAGGLPVASADVHVLNNMSSTTIDINDITATSGMLQIIDAPPGAETYQIWVSKPGYSLDQTYSSVGPTTTNPVKPHATIAVQTVTQLTFLIDRASTVNISSVSPSCAALSNVGVQLTGSKLIGTVPDVLKYDKWYSTGASGVKILNDVEWDTYTIAASSSLYDLAGVMPLSPVAIAPGSTQNVQLIMVPKNSPAVLMTVKDTATGLPVSDATVMLEKGGVSTTQITGHGFLSQTDWSGGSGQSAFGDSAQYASNDGNIDAITVPGEARLLNTFGAYAPSGWLTSSTFDTGSISNFYQFTYQPTSQPVATGDSSVQFQLATSNATSSWTYLGPDGTSDTYYNATTTDISPASSGHRYLRYKMFLTTASTTFTPSVADIQFTFTSSCVPPGQIIFQGLSSGTYDITVTRAGYSTYNGTVVVNEGIPWQEKQVNLAP